MSLFTKDLIERVVRTAVATFAGALVATGSYDKAAITSAAASTLTAVLALVASMFGDPDSGSFMQ